MPHKITTLFASYQQLVADGKIQNDIAQQQVLSLLQNVLDSLSPRKKKTSRLKNLIPAFANNQVAYNLYIHGNVGRGKSMLMDLFFAAAPVAHKRRVHFHAFMQEVHAKIHEIRKKGGGDPVAVLARQISDETKLLCFDELQATDVADATLLYRLFEGLFEHGVCIVSTSNRPPAELYTGGVQAERFSKFIALIEEKMIVVALSSPDDYRYKQGKTKQENYYFPLGESADNFIAQTLKRLGATMPAKQETLVIHGRQINFLAYNKKIGYFTFHELCENALGAADYLALAKLLNTIILANVPALTAEKRNEAKRFVTLIDSIYEQKVQLICTAQTAPENIYNDGDGSFEFHRTVSRLVEMQSENYIDRKQT